MFRTNSAHVRAFASRVAQSCASIPHIITHQFCLRLEHAQACTITCQNCCAAQQIMIPSDDYWTAYFCAHDLVQMRHWTHRTDISLVCILKNPVVWSDIAKARSDSRRLVRILTNLCIMLSLTNANYSGSKESEREREQKTEYSSSNWTFCDYVAGYCLLLICLVNCSKKRQAITFNIPSAAGFLCSGAVLNCAFNYSISVRLRKHTFSTAQHDGLPSTIGNFAGSQHCLCCTVPNQ